VAFALSFDMTGDIQSLRRLDRQCMLIVIENQLAAQLEKG